MPNLEDFVTQSEPIFLHSGSGNLSVSLDTAYHSGAVKIVANRQLPELRKEGKYRILSRLSVAVDTNRWQGDYGWTNQLAHLLPAGHQRAFAIRQRKISSKTGRYGKNYAAVGPDESGRIA